VKIELSCVKRVDRLPALAVELRPTIANVLNKAIDDVSVRANPRTPIDKGNLRANVRRQYATPNKLTARLHWLQSYAAYLEWGTSRGIRPRRFARDSFEEVAPGVEVAIRTVVGGN